MISLEYDGPNIRNEERSNQKGVFSDCRYCLSKIYPEHLSKIIGRSLSEYMNGVINSIIILGVKIIQYCAFLCLKIDFFGNL